MYVKCGVILVSSLFILVIFAEKCTTPNNEESECVSLYTCLPLIKALTKQTPESIGFVRNSQCNSSAGVNSADPKVCCGKFSTQQAPIKIEVEDLSASRQFCGYQHADDYVRKNEYIINIDEYPWLAVIETLKRKKIKPICGEVLINTRYVLTAANCLISFSSLSGVRLGDYYAKNISDCVQNGRYLECSQSQTFGIEEKIPHPNYNTITDEHDIGLIRLDKEVQFSDFIRPICLPKPGGAAAKTDDIVKISGFGKGIFKQQNVDLKKKILSKIISHEDCVKEYEYYTTPVTDNHICSADLHTNYEFSCEGDRGSPVMFSYRTQWQVEGIVSFGKICFSGRPTVHVKVVNYIDWIKKNLKP